jgi:hypothetical protein
MRIESLLERWRMHTKRRKHSLHMRVFTRYIGQTLQFDFTVILWTTKPMPK